MRGAALLLGLLALAGCTSGAESERAEERERERDQPNSAERPRAAADAGVITLSPEAITANDIETVELASGLTWVTTRFPGRVDFNQNATAVAQTPLEGRLQEWRVNIGDRVARGDEIARVESPQNLGTPIVLRALLGGEVIERSGALGDWVKPGDKLAVITNLTTVWVTVQVREDMVAKIRTEAPPAIRVLSFPGDSFTGRFLRISSSVTPETRTIDFLFDVSNPERKLRAGMFAYVSLATDRIDDRLLVREDAVQRINGRSVVFVEKSPGAYQMTEVRLGRKAGEMYELLGGIASGARVVTNGSFVLKSEATRSEFAEQAD